MSKNSSYDAVERFVNILDRTGLRKRLDLSDKDIADTLWLALQMGVENTQATKKPPEPQTKTQPAIENRNTQGVEQVEPPINVYTSSPDVLPKKPQNEEKIEGLPFQAPAAPALPNKLQITRALRPLKRKVPSYSRKILDVEATVSRIVDALIVEQEIWIPITKPQPERWLNLELVVEENRSSFIWQETINELTQILENYGIFHAVRTWNLSGDGNLQLVSRKKSKQTKYPRYNYRELYHSNQRGLILLISDCVSPIWQEETIYNWLEKWSNQCPTAIMQLFPERLWLSSELGLGYKVKLSAFKPGVPNPKLICQEDLDIEPALKLPIITLEPEYLKRWAKVVAGYGRIQTPAIVLDLEFIQAQLRNKKNISPSLEASPEAIVDRFLATASPTAQKLAGLMAAVPVSLPVVHLIQKTMLPKSTPVNVAEVFLSGMIARKNDEYDFVVGVRKLLNQAMQLAETEQVLDVVSEYIAEKMGLSMKSFTALLLNLRNFSQEQQVNLLPFAHVTAEVLTNMGGKYAELAKEIETNKLQKVIAQSQSLFQLFAGEYICAVKWGGLTGAWNEGLEKLLISPQGQVQFYSRFGWAVIQNLIVQEQTLSWSSEHNQTAARINFTENSEDSYFWENNQTGKLFQGWLNYPNEGRIDFRGRFKETLDFPPFQAFEFEVTTIIFEEDESLQPFEFEVATIELKQSGLLNRTQKTAQYYVEELGNGITLEMVVIPEGSFMMGSPEDELERRDSESPQHLVNIQQFFMGKYPVTQEQWRAVAALPQVNKELDADPSRFKGDKRPVEQVSWYDAVEFCDRLTAHTKRQYRLPSEAEWEYACRAGTTTPFHFGETITTDVANYRGIDDKGAKWSGSYGRGPKGIYREETTSVGSFEAANAFGLYDMHGNVWEWCLEDWHSNYEGAPNDGSAWFDKNDNLSQKQGRAVLRGGSWINDPVFCRSASRDLNFRGYHYGNIGLRVVCAAGRILR